jgi:hypothetical protein
MELKAALQDKDTLERAISDFERSLCLEFLAKGQDPSKASLPTWMRLTDYFLANGKDATYWGVAQQASINGMPYSSKEINTNNNLTFFAGDTALFHLPKIRGKKKMATFFAEYLRVGDKDDFENPLVKLFSGSQRAYLIRGHNQINLVGATVSVDVDDYFKNFLAKHNELDYDRSEYAVKSHGEVLIATPVFTVSKDTFKATMEDLVDITNQVLKVLEKEYYKRVTYLKNPA